MSDLELRYLRTRLRMVRLSDLNFVHELHSLKETDMFNTLGIPSSESETMTILKSWLDAYQATPVSAYTFIIQHASNQKEMGLICLKMGNPKYNRAEVWFKLHVDFWNHGYASEALKAILNFGFDKLQLHRIEAGCAVDNVGSIKVLEKAGFTREGRGRQVLPLKSGWSDNFEYGLLRSEHISTNAKK